MSSSGNSIRESTEVISTSTVTTTDEDIALTIHRFEKLGDAYFERSGLTRSETYRNLADFNMNEAIQLWDTVAAGREDNSSSCLQALRLKKQYERFGRSANLDRAIGLFAIGVPHLGILEKLLSPRPGQMSLRPFRSQREPS
jgi:hypothetical protein